MTSSAPGFSMVELLFALSIAATVTAIGVPQAVHALDDFRARGAAHYLAMRVADARMRAIKHSSFVGLRFEPVGADDQVTMVADGNGNGIRTADVLHGDDPVIAAPERLTWHFDGVTFGILPGVPDADGRAVATPDGIHVGASRILSMNPNGSSSAGTLYVHGRGRTQYAVRVLGPTGRVRVLRFDSARQVWTER